MKRELIIVVALVLLILPQVSAEILVGQTETLYNIGDEFEITVTVKPTSDTSNFFTASLVCGSTEVEIYKSPLNIKSGAEKTITIAATLDNFLVSGAVGTCHIKTNYGAEESKSQTFELSGNIDVTLDVVGLIFSPEDEVKISGKAKKSNEESINGFIEISIPGIEFSSIDSVNDGSYNITFIVPANAKSGSYDITVKAYEKDSNNEITNQGEASGTIKIKQVLKEIEIAAESQSIIPENEFSYTIFAYDQAQDPISSDISVSILSPEKVEITKVLLKAGESNTFFIEKNYAPGNWRIYAKAQDLETTKDFIVEEYKKLSFKLENDFLVVENVGNSPYNEAFEVSIGGTNQIIELENLAVGGTDKFRLRAPDGQYQIEINDGAQKQLVGSALLTGRAISVGGAGALSGSIIFLIVGVIIVIAALIIIYFYRKKIKERFIRKTSGSFTPSANSPVSATNSPQSINKGVKQECSIVSLNVKNLVSLNSESLKIVDSALWKAKENGAKIYSDGNFRIVVFTPLSKETDIALTATRTAEQIERLINTYNRRSAQKVEFGVGVNAGDLIVETVGGKFKFVSLENSIGLTKRISQNASNEVIVSEKIRGKMLGKLKATKLQDKNLWKIEKITDRTAHEDFINKFKQRQKGTSKY